MKILRIIYDLIITNAHPIPPETGGILGGKNQIISRCIFDNGSDDQNGYDIYIPNTQLLNQKIRQWADFGIDLYGIFHSHFLGAEELSNGDKRYISEIMRALPQQTGSLYFPIVIPKEKIIAYRADIYGQELCIVSDKIEII